MPDNPPNPSPPPADPPPANPPPPPGPSTAELQAQLERQAGELKRARDEAAKYRTRNDEETGGLKKALAGWLGIEDDKQPDAARMLEEFQKRDSARERELARLRQESALERSARQHGADVDILAPYLRGSGRLDKLDASAPDYADQLDGLVKELVERIPKFKAANGHGGQAPPRGGSEFPGGNQGPPLLTRDDLRGMSPDAIEKARKDGRIAGVSPG